MAYSITGMTSAPDVGFRCESRHTAKAARDLATAYIVAGMREVEIRDGSGNLGNVRDLEEVADANGLDDAAVAARLATL